MPEAELIMRLNNIMVKKISICLIMFTLTLGIINGSHRITSTTLHTYRYNMDSLFTNEVVQNYKFNLASYTSTPSNSVSSISNQLTSASNTIISKAVQIKALETTTSTTQAPQSIRTYESPAILPASNNGSLASDFACIAKYESGTQDDNTGNGYYGYFQFTISTWENAGGGGGLPSDYTYEQQLQIAENVIINCHYSCWHTQWPRTSYDCGL